jgi:hypothetical protein
MVFDPETLHAHNCFKILSSNHGLSSTRPLIGCCNLKITSEILKTGVISQYPLNRRLHIQMVDV